jgi:hypothetical protein
MLPLALDIEPDPYTARQKTNECYGLSQAAVVTWIRSKYTFWQHTSRGSVPGITGSATDEDYLARSATPRLDEVRKLERGSSEIL